MTECQQKVYDYIIECWNMYGRMPTQKELIYSGAVSRRWVTKVLQDLEEKGLLVAQYPNQIEYKIKTI